VSPLADDLLFPIAISARVLTAGQPDSQGLQAVAAAGYQVVINLGLHGTPYALPDQAEVVRRLGMDYHHIPVSWEAPHARQLDEFIELMDRLTTQRLFIHCAANKRVTVFMALYLGRSLGWDRSQVVEMVARRWDLTPVWDAFLTQQWQRVA